MNYFTMIRSKNLVFDLRLDMVVSARRLGVRAAARALGCDPRTVRKWNRRYDSEGTAGLADRSRAPKTCPHRTRPHVEAAIIRSRRQTCFSARRLKDEFGIPASVGAIQRIIRQAGLSRTQRRKPHRNSRDHRAEKLAQQPLTHFQMDTKDLCDIPSLRPLIDAGFPRYQYTVRDECTGAMLISLAPTLEATFSCLVVERLLKHLKAHGRHPAEVSVRTDNGGEFNRRLDPDAPCFVHTVETVCAARHIFNPPHCPNANPDVESVHNTIENDFYNLETFTSLQDFQRKVTLFQHYYNIARLNYSKGKRSPLDILESKEGHGLSPGILLLAPIVRGRIPSRCRPPPQVGHDLPALVE